ncbi:hypothetical protein KM043_003487 [Ampulex compressa]|nr:hypothetical protein KM043_003487 [Ampulex compressa]
MRETVKGRQTDFWSQANRGQQSLQKVNPRSEERGFKASMIATLAASEMETKVMEQGGDCRCDRAFLDPESPDPASVSGREEKWIVHGWLAWALVGDRRPTVTLDRAQ